MPMTAEAERRWGTAPDEGKMIDVKTSPITTDNWRTRRRTIGLLPVSGYLENDGTPADVKRCRWAVASCGDARVAGRLAAVRQPVTVPTTRPTGRVREVAI